MIQTGAVIKKVQLILLAIGSMLSIHAQTISAEQYIEQYKDIAMLEMKRMSVPAAITLAQGLLESESGNSELVKKSNNHFGIKCKSNWTGEGVTHDDDSLGECFRKYATAEESFRDHSNFLKAGKHYSFLFDLDPTDYRGWANGLKKAGYATNPKYPVILINYIEKYNLQRFTIGAAEELTNSDTKKSKDDPPLLDQKTSVAIAALPVDRSALGEGELILLGEPDVVNIVNGSKCIKALKGTSLLAIATRYKISLQRLLDINELEDGLLDEDQLIFLQKKSTKGNKDFVVVRKNETYFSSIQSLEPGHNLNYKDNKLTISKYWSYPSEQKAIDTNEAVHQLKELFDNSLQLHVRSDVPIGATLSGGIDSSSIVSSLLKNKMSSNEKIHPGQKLKY